MRHRATKITIRKRHSVARGEWLLVLDDGTQADVIEARHALSFAAFLRRAAGMIERDAEKRKGGK